MSSLKCEVEKKNHQLVICLVGMLFVLKIVNLLLLRVNHAQVGMFLTESLCVIVFLSAIFFSIIYGRAVSFICSLAALLVFTLLILFGVVESPQETNIMNYTSLTWFYASLFIGNGFALFL
ncbi:hypothetical protein HN858_01915 [Candidatus Falkowbacteria bacterium]|jgi:hypothetical protein|nr:hypothetical protein [Candidatus Falkowbacteria bacterium]MBT6573603.1 hypothetical protein [Candidatus Falkowbacteria bacterium]MBT7348411.1 hypothetical protein [Candidatus Falkowbacteria bacterium]MBT7500635.1 hypothetical protein [Candidatus Falkowbacteria bacterium]